MKIKKDIRIAILERIQNSQSITVAEVVAMFDTRGEEPDIARLIENEKKNTARKVLASIRGKDKVRSCFALCDKERTFINVELCDVYEQLLLAEQQLMTKRNGLNRSLGKVARLKRAFGKCASQNGERSEEATVLADKLYAMADELQSLLGVRIAV